MYWLLLSVGGVVAFVVITVIALWVLGGRLPEAHEASTSATLPTSAQALFEFVTDRDLLTGWRSDLQRIEPLDPVDGKPAWREIGKYGKIELCVVEALPPTATNEGRYITRITNDDAPFGGQWTWIFAPDGEGNCRLTITENGTIKSRPIRAMAHHFIGMDATVNAVLAALLKQAPRG